MPLDKQMIFTLLFVGQTFVNFLTVSKNQRITTLNSFKTKLKKKKNY